MAANFDFLFTCRGTNNDSLRDAFSQYGNVMDCIVMTLVHFPLYLSSVLPSYHSWHDFSPWSTSSISRSANVAFNFFFILYFTLRNFLFSSLIVNLELEDLEVSDSLLTDNKLKLMPLSKLWTIKNSCVFDISSHLIFSFFRRSVKFFFWLG